MTPHPQRTYAERMNTRFFKLVDGMYFHEVPFEELERRYFECKKEIEEKEIEEKEKKLEKRKRRISNDCKDYRV